MKNKFLCIGIVLVCIVFFTSCGSPKYVHKDPVFSYEYPLGYKAEPLQGTSEVARFANQSQYKIPVYVATVADREKGVKLGDVPKSYVAAMKKDLQGSARYKILEQKVVKLSDGSDAVAWKLKWRWVDGISMLQSAAVNAYQGGKLITVMGTTAYGGDVSMDKLLEQCMTLQLQ